MLAKELKEKLADIPDNAFVYLDDHAMPTPMGLAEVDVQISSLYKENGLGEILLLPEAVTITTLATYKIPVGGWQNDQSVTRNLNGLVGTISKSKKKKSKKKPRR